MSRFTTTQIGQMSDDQVCARLTHATGSAYSTDSATNTTPLPHWHAQLADPEWLIDPFKEAWEFILRHWITNEPLPPWWRVLCENAGLLDAEYAKVGQTRDTSMSLRMAVNALYEFIDETGWTPTN